MDNIIIWNGTIPIAKNAYFLSHNGLGDNITSIGAVNFLLQYYDTVIFLCKDTYKKNVELLYANKAVVVVPYDSTREFEECANIINSVDKMKYDIFVSGMHKIYLKSHITNRAILEYQKSAKYTAKYDHVTLFYNDIGLDLSIYFDYFDMSSSELSLAYYKKIKDYKIVFMHTVGSNRSVDLSHIVEQYKDKDEYILICADKNVYKDPSHPKYVIAEQYVNLKIVYYIDIIMHATCIHVLNSCFECIVYPLAVTKRIQPEEYIVYS